MAITPPNLDDRTFEQLLADAKERAARTCPEWTDWSPGNPGVALVELFAYLTETMIYRLNRLPEKAYVEFLRLMGVQLRPPSAAGTVLRFSRRRNTSAEDDDASLRGIVIPSGTRVSTDSEGGGPAVVFVTAETFVMEVDQDHVEIPALHCEQIDAESFVGTGLPGQSITVSRSSIVARTGENNDLVVGVQSTPDEIGTSRHRKHGEDVYRVWSEVEHFADLRGNRQVYVVDRAAGTVMFAPSIRAFAGENGSFRPEALADLPAKDQRIRVWYRTGGGVEGNVAAGRLTKILDPIDGEVDVVNPQAATGGAEVETLADALVRGPQQLHSMDRAVTARDFERIACSFGAVSRAQAAAQAELWAHSRPGTVEVLLVPDVELAARRNGRLAVEQLQARQTDDAIERVSARLNECRPLGASLDVRWVDFKVVRARARIRAFSGEDVRRIQSQIRERLDLFISPLSTPSMPQGWPFGQALPAGRLYDEIFRVPGVKEIESLRLIEDDAPTDPIRSLAADHFQSSAWYAVSGNRLHRSFDDGRSWQRTSLTCDGEVDERMLLVRPHAGQPGYVAVATQTFGESVTSGVHFSADCGRTWRLALRTPFPIHDVAWIQRGGRPAILLAASCGLYELAVNEGDLTQLAMAGIPADAGFWSIAVTNDTQGQPVEVAVAARSDHGVWISYEGGRSRTFLPVGLNAYDVRTLAFQTIGSTSYLWAGARVVGNQPGVGCFRWEGPVEKWRRVSQGWPGGAGSCLSLSICGSQLFAGTYGDGVVRLDSSRSDGMTWQTVGSDCGLPGGDDDRRFAPIKTLAVEPTGGILMVGCDAGMYHSRDGGRRFQLVCEKERIDGIPLPRQMLFCAGEHELEVLTEE